MVLVIAIHNFNGLVQPFYKGTLLMRPVLFGHFKNSIQDGILQFLEMRHGLRGGIIILGDSMHMLGLATSLLVIVED